MGKKITDLLEEVDEVIAKRASAPKEVVSEKDVFAMADQLRKQASPEQPVVEEEVESVETPIQTLNEKVAHALALTEVYANLPFFQRLSEFEKRAAKNGLEEQEVISFLEKKAFHQNYITLDKLIPWMQEG